MNTEKTNVPVKTEGFRPMFRPFALFDDLRTEFEQLWQKPWLPMFRTERFRGFEETPWMPRIDAFEKDGELIVKADLPGMKREDVHVALEEGDLILKGERKEETEIKKESFYKAECAYGSFYRRLPLAFKVDFDKIVATFADGVLTVRIPMPAQEKPTPFEIPIN